MSLLWTLDRETFIEVFDLGGPMKNSVELENMNETFKNHNNSLTRRVRWRHVPKSKKEKGELPKKVGDFMPL